MLILILNLFYSISFWNHCYPKKNIYNIDYINQWIKIFTQWMDAIFTVLFVWNQKILQCPKIIINCVQFVRITNYWHGVENVFVIILNKLLVLTKNVVKIILNDSFNDIHIFHIFLDKYLFFIHYLFETKSQKV